MTDSPTEVLNKLSTEYNALIKQLDSAHVLVFKRTSIIVEVTVPKDVLEWFIDVYIEKGTKVIDWWCDYEGYDETPKEALSSQMSTDIDTMVRGLLTQEIRLTPKPKASCLKFESMGFPYV